MGKSVTMKLAIAGAASLMAVSCATLSAGSRIESQLVGLGLSAARADCLADQLTDRLDHSDLNAVADFLQGLNRAETPGGTLDALLSIDNPRAAAAIARSGIACALDG